MPKLDIVTINEAKVNSATGKRAEILREYIGYIQAVPAGQAGKLAASAQETTNAIRRRLGNAAKALGVGLAVRRTGDAIFFWVEQPARKRRGRKPKNAA
jgi:hypothetical protein